MGNAVLCGTDGSCRASGFQRCAPYEVRLAATEILHVAGISGYHTSIIIDDREYFFDSVGIMAAPPLTSHGPPEKRPEMKTAVIEIGRSTCSGNALVQALQPLFEPGTYDIFLKNCNSYTDVALYYLTRTRLPGCYSRLERFVAATSPVSTGLLNKMFRAFIEKKTGKPCEEDVYVTNPEAENFSVENVIASLESTAFEDTDSDASEFD
mmetsp:Transcript_24790/g.71253  ORF Transcript_24790/g.71253 Transcript_24790/m.71253 type:complete len:209 (-) Transcript_24790:74-700(-)